MIVCLLFNCLGCQTCFFPMLFNIVKACLVNIDCQPGLACLTCHAFLASLTGQACLACQASQVCQTCLAILASLACHDRLVRLFLLV